jgi:adenine-specific DNA-methyltransferase
MAKKPIDVDVLRHDGAKRRNIPTAEFEPVLNEADRSPVRLAYERRNRDLDPQLVWRGKDEQDWSDLVVAAPPLFIQEKVHPKVLIDDLLRQSRSRRDQVQADIPDLFADFNGLPDEEARCEFYAHEQNWSNRMILGDSLQVMASLAEREGLRGKVQCIYLDPPYGIKFNSNFQWSTTSRDVKDGNAAHITREPEQVKAFRDTWRDGIHSYLTYLRDRLTVARDLLAETGSIFVQIGDENVHRVRAVMDEVFGEENFVTLITVWKTSSQTSVNMASTSDYVVWYARDVHLIKYRELKTAKEQKDPCSGAGDYKFIWLGHDQRKPIAAATDEEKKKYKIFGPSPTTSQSGSETTRVQVNFHGKSYLPGPGGWKTNSIGFRRLIAADRIMSRTNSLRYVRFLEDYPVVPVANLWTDVRWGFDAGEKRYVVETNPQVIARCILMTTDPGDLMLDPTCGSGTTAYVAEQWGRRWITVDTSRVALALARARIMGARYPWYILADSPEGQRKEWEVSGKQPVASLRATEESAAIQTGSPGGSAPREDARGILPATRGDVRHGFVYERVPHVTLKSIANNAEIDVIWERYQVELEPLRMRLNAALGTSWEEWEIPRTLTPTLSQREREVGAAAREGTLSPREREGPAQREGEGDDAEAERLLARWWELRIARQKEIDASIAAKADVEYLYDKPYVDGSRVRVAGPFTVESLSPHRMLAADQERAPGLSDAPPALPDEERDFAALVLEHLKTAGVQQAHKQDRIVFTSLTGWPGEYIAAEGRYLEGEAERRAGVFIGPEFGTVPRPDLVAAAREAGDAGFDVLIACAFNYDAHASDFEKLGRIPVLKARMNADLHMAGELKNTGQGNLFVIFGEPDIDIEPAGEGEVRVRINGVDVFHPQTGEITSSGPDGIACWFIDTDYNEESFFVRHAYFLGAGDPYKALKTTLKAEIDEDAWASLNSDVSRPFARPSSGRIAVKVINHLGDEVMKVFAVK